MSVVFPNSFLASIIGAPRGSEITDRNQYRRYCANVRTESTIGGNRDSRATQIYYEVGRRYDRVGRALHAITNADQPVEAAYPTAGILVEDFIGLAKKYTNFSASFEYSSLAGMVERLGKSLAAVSIYEQMSSNDLRGGNALHVNALGTYDGPVNSLVNTVFIPRLVDSSITGDVFCVLANAAAGENARVTTDVVELDANTRQPIIPVVHNDGLARAIVSALRILGSNMIASDQGPLFSWALTRGIHSVVSVVGHTDEGAVTRDLLRARAFSTPFGGIHYGLNDYAGLPALSSNQAQEIAAYVDTLALTTAGLVAHCDPGLVYNGLWFPTVFQGTGPTTPEVRPGGSQEGTVDMRERNRRLLIDNWPAFLDIYLPALAKLFSAGGDSQLAIVVARTQASTAAGDSRHLQFPSIAPYYWIEPTSLIPHDFVGSRAEAEGCGAFATVSVPRTKLAWEEIEQVSRPGAPFTAFNVSARSPRANWFFAHWLGHPANGLGAISVRQLDPNTVIHPGPCAAHPDVRDRVENGLGWADYLWVRGQSPFCAPGELLNLSGVAGMMVRHYTFDDDGIPTEEHLPTEYEFKNTFVTIAVSRPIGLRNGASNAPDNGTRRARTRATRELAAATARANLFGVTDIAAMPISTSAPVFSRRRDDSHFPVDGPGRGGAQRADNGAADGGSYNEGVPPAVTPTVHHDAQRGPPLPPQGRPGGGGGARAEPVPANAGRVEGGVLQAPGGLRMAQQAPVNPPVGAGDPGEAGEPEPQAIGAAPPNGPNPQ